MIAVYIWHYDPVQNVVVGLFFFLRWSFIHLIKVTGFCYGQKIPRNYLPLPHGTDKYKS